MFKFCSIVLIKSESLAYDTEVYMLCVNAGEILMAATDEYITTEDDVVKELAGFVCC